MFGFLIFVIFGLIMFGIQWAYRAEKLSWNSGICVETGKYWIIFDMDSSGARGYTSGDYTTWISWNHIDKDYNGFSATQLNNL
jgi:hypothetical protein